jgi:hypothetical protein
MVLPSSTSMPDSNAVVGRFPAAAGLAVRGAGPKPIPSLRPFPLGPRPFDQGAVASLASGPRSGARAIPLAPPAREGLGT